MIVSTNAGKAFDKIPHLLIVKILGKKKKGILENFLNLQRASNKKPTANIIVKGERLHSFSLISGARKGCLPHCYTST